MEHMISVLCTILPLVVPVPCLFACAIDIVQDNFGGIVLSQVVHRDDELVVAGVVA